MTASIRAEAAGPGAAPREIGVGRDFRGFPATRPVLIMEGMNFDRKPPQQRLDILESQGNLAQRDTDSGNGSVSFSQTTLNQVTIGNTRAAWPSIAKVLQNYANWPHLSSSFDSFAAALAISCLYVAYGYKEAPGSQITPTLLNSMMNSPEAIYHAKEGFLREYGKHQQTNR